MTFCNRCGATVGGDALACPSCGQPFGGFPAPAPVPGTPGLRLAPVDPWEAPPPRPIGVTIVAVVSFVFLGFFALVALFIGGVLATVLPIVGFLGPFAAILVLFMLGFVGLGVAVGIGLLKGWTWAYVVFLVFAALSILQSLLGLASGEFDGILPLLIWGGVAFYFFRPEVRAWFRIGTG